jgi:hypothetical protein
MPDGERVTTGSEPRRCEVGVLLRHHSGDLWQVAEVDLPGDDSWGTGEDAGMVVVAGDYRIRCLAGREKGRITRVHAEYIPRSFEVVESGHDEQTEVQKWIDECNDVGAECSRLESDQLEIHDALEAAGHPGAINAQSIIERIEALAGERERTVAAVVEALREAAAELAPNEPAQASGVPIGIDRIENDPRFKPSAPGGDDGH